MGVVDTVIERRRSGSLPDSREDGKILALAIEGGGMAGAVSAGMCVALEELDLINSFDRIYGCSSGALNGVYTRHGQAKEGINNYLETANRKFSNYLRLFKGDPVINFNVLFDEVIQNNPLTPKEKGPNFLALAIDLDTFELKTLRDFINLEESVKAVRASCSLPILSGPPLSFRGSYMIDGGLLESIPYHTALIEGADEIMVLRSKTVDYRKKEYQRGTMKILHRYYPDIAPLIERRPKIYNSEADFLQKGILNNITQITVSKDWHITQLSHRLDQIWLGIHEGKMAARKIFGELSF